MKTTIDIPEKEFRDVLRFTGAKTKREAVVTAVADFNRRRRMAALVRYLGTCEHLMTPAELRPATLSEFVLTALGRSCIFGVYVLAEV